MTRLTVKWITAVLTRLLYFMVVSVLLLALLITLEHGLPPTLRSRLTSSSQAANPQQTEDGTWTTYNTSNSELVSDYILSIMDIDEEWRAYKWFGTNSGVSKFDGENWTSYDTSNSGLVDNCVNAIATDPEGDKWFGTNSGVSKFDGATWTTYDISNPGLASNTISAIAMDHSGNVWIGTSHDGVSKFDGATWTTYDTSNSGLADDSINAITIDHSGNVWIGTSFGGVSKFDGATWTTYDTSNSGLVINHVRSIAIDTADVKWFGGCIGGEWSPGVFVCDAATVTRFDGSTWTIYIAGYSGLVGGEVNAIAIDQKGNKWFGTSDAGVSKFDGATWTTYDTSNSELQSDHITSIAVDNQWNIWFGTYGGGVTRHSLPTATLAPGKRIQIPRIDKGEGWDTRIHIQNVGDAQTGVIALFWGDYSSTCPPSAPGPVAHLCHHIPGNWGIQAVKDEIPAEAKSAILYSVSDDLFQAACEAAGNIDSSEAWINWEDTFAYSGEPLAVAVNRRAYNGSSVSGMYNGFSETMLGLGVPYGYFAPHITHGYNNFDSTITIQNSGDNCSSVWLYYKEERNCEYMKAQHIERIAPGEAIRIGPGPDAHMPFPTPELDAPWLGSVYVTANEPLAIVVDRWDTDSTMLLTHAGFPYLDYGATTNYTSLIYRDFDGWNAEIHVQNLTQNSKATFLTVDFFDMSGDEILFVGDWVCRNGTTTYYLSDIIDLGVNPPFEYVGTAEIQSHEQVDYPGEWDHPGEPIASVVSLINSNSGEALSYNAFTLQQVTGVTTFASPLISNRSQGDSSEVATANLSIRNNSPCNKFWGRIWIWDETGTSVGVIDVPWLYPKHLNIIDLAYQEFLPDGFVGAATFEVLGVEQLCDVDGDGYMDNEPIMPSVVMLNRDPDASASGQEAFPIKDGPVAVVVEMTPSSPVKAETVEFEVTFSEQMNAVVAPTVTIGTDAPYTDYTIAPKTGAGYTNGYLDSDPTKWYGTYSFTDIMGDGMYHISIVGAEDSLGNPIATDTRNMFILDTVPPSSSVTDLPTYQPTLSFPVSWSGSDATSGIASYNVQYRDRAGSWTDWLTETTETSAIFTGESGHTYYFQSQASDNAGNVEDYPGGDGDAHVCVLFGDFDPNGRIDVADIMKVANCWRMTDEDPDWDPRYDLNSDGIITVVDIMLVVAHWGETCG